MEEFGKAFTSDYVLDEFVSRMISHGRVKGKGVEKDFLENIRKGEDAIEVHGYAGLQGLEFPRIRREFPLLLSYY